MSDKPTRAEHAMPNRHERRANAKLARSAAARDHNEDPLFDTEQAGLYLNINPRTLEGWRSKGIGPAFVKLMRCARYRLSSLQQFAAQGERKTAVNK